MEYVGGGYIEIYKIYRSLFPIYIPHCPAFVSDAGHIVCVNQCSLFLIAFIIYIDIYRLYRDYSVNPWFVILGLLT